MTSRASSNILCIPLRNRYLKFNVSVLLNLFLRAFLRGPRTSSTNASAGKGLKGTPSEEVSRILPVELKWNTKYKCPTAFQHLCCELPILCPPVGENVCDVMNKVGMCARSVSYVTSLFFGFLLMGSEPVWLYPAQRSSHSKRKIWCTNINKNDHTKPANANHRLTLPFCVWQNQYGCVLRCSGVDTKTKYTDWQNDHIKLSDRNNYTFSAFWVLHLVWRVTRKTETKDTDW